MSDPDQISALLAILENETPSAVAPLLKNAEKALACLRFQEENPIFILAFSGGKDSLFLLLLLSLWKKKAPYSFELHLAHVCHALREEAAAEPEKIAALARAQNLPCHILNVDQERLRARAVRIGTEAAAREERYAALFALRHRLALSASRRARDGERTCMVQALPSSSAFSSPNQMCAELHRQQTSPYLFLAHQGDDRAEGVLLNLFRGSGYAGLASLREREGCLCRPLLSCFRADIDAFYRFFHLEALEDSSNRSRRFTRNRVRLDVLPMMEEYLPGDPKKTLLRAAENLAELREFMEKTFRPEDYFENCFEAEELLTLRMREERGEVRTWGAFAFKEALRQRLSKKFFSLERCHYDAIYNLICSDPNSERRLSLPDGLSFFYRIRAWKKSGEESPEKWLCFGRSACEAEKILRRMEVQSVGLCCGDAPPPVLRQPLFRGDGEGSPVPLSDLSYYPEYPEAFWAKLQREDVLYLKEKSRTLRSFFKKKGYPLRSLELLWAYKRGTRVLWIPGLFHDGEAAKQASELTEETERKLLRLNRL